MERTELFWADQLAKQVIERAEKEKAEIVIRCGQTPSGGKHIGNLNDVVRAYFVYKSILEKGYKASFVHSTDDRDPLKDIPARLADLGGNWHSSEKFPTLKNYLGHPLCRVPDPFGCCTSWAQHFTKLWEIGLNKLGMFPKIVSNDDYYKKGRFDPYIRKVFEKIDAVGKIVAEFQETKGESYIPFDAICPNCGMLANISSFDLDTEQVSFICGGKAIKKKRSEGCGFEGSVHFREGKLQWRFEWPAQWAVECTTFEPFGKDHFEGSWKSGQVIAREIYNIEPPLPYVYEFFLVNGQKMSASKGNVYITQDLLKIIEPEVFLYFYTKRPGKQRDLSLKEIFRMADEFDALEKNYFAGKQKDERERINIERAYFFSMEKIPESLPVRIPYTFAAMVSQIIPEQQRLEKALQLLKATGHITKRISEQDKNRIALRLQLAKNWVELYTPEQKISLLEKPTAETLSKLTDKQKKALLSLAKELEKKEFSEKELHTKIFDISRENAVEPKQLFSAVYQALLGRPAGPRLAPFILAIGQEEVAKRLKLIS